MKEQWWSVHVAAHMDPTSDEVVESLLEVLPEVGGFSPSLSWKEEELGATVSVEADDAGQAAVMAQDAFLRATRKLGIGVRRVYHVDAMTHERLEEELEREPEQYLGVSEIAGMLGVSKQRVAELRGKPGFPAPVAELRAGPVWTESSLRRFVAEWPRRPGRPDTWLAYVQEALEKQQAEGELDLAKLTDAERAAILMLLTVAGVHDVAKKLGVTPEAVRSRIRRAIEKLQVPPDPGQTAVVDMIHSEGRTGSGRAVARR